jgi:hypothetical protein
MFRSLAVVVVFSLAVVSWAAQTRTRLPARPSPSEERNSLLRMDLLQRPREGMTPPQRNIFAPRTGASRPVENFPYGGQQALPNDRAPDTPDQPAEGTAAPPVFSVSLRYIGFIESSRRIIALVVFEGQAIAVVEGEVVSEGIRIGKITRDQIEIVLPDSTTRRFPLEGE